MFRMGEKRMDMDVAYRDVYRSYSGFFIIPAGRFSDDVRADYKHLGFRSGFLRILSPRPFFYRLMVAGDIRISSRYRFRWGVSNGAMGGVGGRYNR